MPTSAIGDRFAAVCRDRGSAAAVYDLADGSTVTFADLQQHAALLERALADAGVGRGSCVVAMIGNRAAFFSAFVACMEAGAALVPLGEVTDAEAAAVIEQSGAIAVLAARSVPVAGRSAARCGTTHPLTLVTVGDRPPARRYGDGVVLKLTSGSTNLPKAAIASERHLINDGRHIVDAMGIGPDDVNLACIPLSHSYGLGNLVMPLLWQGTRVALRSSFNPAQLASDVAAAGVTVFPGVPFMFEHIRSSALDRLPPSLRLLITAGARIDPQTVVWFREHLDRKIHSFYGSSETGGIAYDDREDVPDPLDVGRAMPETDISIVSDDRGAGGRVFVRGNAVCFGYADTGAAADGSPFQEGGFLTGDLGYIDPAGRLVLTGRASELVNVAGRKVDPAEVERTLLALPGVADARVLGMACDRRGQQVVAFVVRSDPALTPVVIRQRCAATLSTYKIPRRFVFLDRLPVDARGKTDRRALQALAGGDDALR